MSAKSFLRTLAVAAALALGVGAPGYDIIRDGSAVVKWSNGTTINMQVKLGTSPTLQDGTNYSSSAIAAMESWNAVLRNVQLAGTVATAGAGGDRDGVNELFFAANVFGEAFGENVIAVTVSYRSSTVQADGTYRRTQSDIIFNNAKTWDSYRGATQGSTLDLRRVALHELGHSLGLDHPDEIGQAVTAIMNSHVSGIDALQRDDLDGAQFLYGTPGTITRPVNDDFTGATEITIPATNTVTVTGSSVNASKQTGEPSHATGESGGASVWWKWTAPFNGTLVVQTAGSNFDTLLGAYTGTSVGALTQLAGNDDAETPEQNPAPTRKRTSIVTISVTSGTTYHFAVDGWEAEWGSVSLTLDYSPIIPDSAPTITTHPQSQSVLVGTSVVFSVVATGKPNPTYQWKKGGNAIAGATDTTLSLPNAQTTDAGNYTVTVTNSLGAVTSNTATLAVTPPVAPPSSSGGGGGGGGAPSAWFFAAAALVGALRAWSRGRRR